VTLDFAPKLARVITEYSTEISEGDFVVIIGSPKAIPLIEALYQAVLERGGHPTTVIGLPSLTEILVEIGNEKQLAFINPAQKMIYEQADVIMQIEAPTNMKLLAHADPAKLITMQQSSGPVLQHLIERIGEGSVRWVMMPWPTDAIAQQTEMGTRAYTEFLYKACGLNHEDPVRHWQSVRDRQFQLVEYLTGKSHAKVRGPGIELSFALEGRNWVSAHGTLNFPDGEIFTCPVEDSVQGKVSFNMPTFYMGKEVNGAELVFKDGVVTSAKATKGEAFLIQNLELDEGARRLGEFAIGTNFGIDRVTGSTLLDEKIGGSIHMALGAAAPQTGGENASKIHWDMVHDMKAGGEIEIDGEIIYREGDFLID
jgi:aminopeptidase